GHVQHLHVGLAPQQPLGQLAPVDLRHDHVGHRQRHVADLLLGQLQRLQPVPGLPDGVAVVLEDLPRQPPDHVLVLDQQHRPLPPPPPPRPPPPPPRAPARAPPLASASSSRG